MGVSAVWKEDNYSWCSSSFIPDTILRSITLCVSSTTGTMASDDKITDAQLMGEKQGTLHEEAMHWGQLTEEEVHVEKKLLLRIDMLIMPLVILVYLMNYIDRNNYAAARLQGLEKDLNLKGDQYQVGLSILFVAYVLMQVPSNLLLNYSGRPSWYLGFFTVAWGLVSALTSQVSTYGQIVACRFILGLVEAPFFAGVLFYLSKWYSKKELSLRMAIFYSGSLISGAFGNLIAAGILSGLAGARGMSAWQWLYIIEGSITVLIGLTIVVILPDFPDTWGALTPEMKRVANRRRRSRCHEPSPRLEARLPRPQDLYPSHRLPRYHRRRWLSELLPHAHRHPGLQPRHFAIARRTALRLSGLLLIPAQLDVRQGWQPLLVLHVPHPRGHRWLCHLHDHRQLRPALLQSVPLELCLRHERDLLRLDLQRHSPSASQARRSSSIRQLGRQCGEYLDPIHILRRAGQPLSCGTWRCDWLDGPRRSQCHRLEIRFGETEQAAR